MGRVYDGYSTGGVPLNALFSSPALPSPLHFFLRLPSPSSISHALSPVPLPRPTHNITSQHSTPHAKSSAQMKREVTVNRTHLRLRPTLLCNWRSVRTDSAISYVLPLSCVVWCMVLHVVPHCTLCWGNKLNFKQTVRLSVCLIMREQHSTAQHSLALGVRRAKDREVRSVSEAHISQ